MAGIMRFPHSHNAAVSPGSSTRYAPHPRGNPFARAIPVDFPSFLAGVRQGDCVRPPASRPATARIGARAGLKPSRAFSEPTARQPGSGSSPFAEYMDGPWAAGSASRGRKARGLAEKRQLLDEIDNEIRRQRALFIVAFGVGASSRFGRGNGGFPVIGDTSRLSDMTVAVATSFRKECSTR